MCMYMSIVVCGLHWGGDEDSIMFMYIIKLILLWVYTESVVLYSVLLMSVL